MQTLYLSWMVSRCSSCWLKVRPWTLMLGGRISATHCRELRPGDLDSMYGGNRTLIFPFLLTELILLLHSKRIHCYRLGLVSDFWWANLERGNVVGARLEDSSASVWSEEKSDGPSSTTRVGTAPLPCSIDTTFSWEQFLKQGEQKGETMAVSCIIEGLKQCAQTSRITALLCNTKISIEIEKLCKQTYIKTTFNRII